MERFSKIIPFIRKRDPIINSLNLCSIELDDEMFSQLIDSLKSNVFITKIVLNQNKLTENAVNSVVDLLLSNPKLCFLDISDNCVNNASIEHLSRVLQELPQNREPIMLILRKNVFDSAGVAYLAQAISRNCPVHWLDLRDNPNIGDCGVEAISVAISENKTLAGLDIIKCKCDERGCSALSDSLLDNKTLTTLLIQDQLSLASIHSIGHLLADPACSLQALYLWKCGLNGTLLDVLCRSLRSNRSLTTVALSYNRIDDTGAIYLADMILKNKSLVKLQLGANVFTPASAGYFGIALSKNTTLQFLDLSRNFLKAVGIWPIAVALMDNKELKSIDLRHNRIDSQGAEMICELMAKNSSLRSIRLSGNCFGDSALSMISKKLIRNTSIKELELMEIGISGVGFIDACSALICNDTLEKVMFSGNLLSVDAMKAFSSLLKKNSSLLYVYISDCGINDDGCEFIAEGLSSNSTLKLLDLSNNSIKMPGLTMIADSILGNFSLLQVDLKDNLFAIEDGGSALLSKITDYLERNTYYQHNILMKELSQLAEDANLCSAEDFNKEEMCEESGDINL